jgi:hypothetical protein
MHGKRGNIARLKSTTAKLGDEVLRNRDVATHNPVKLLSRRTDLDILEAMHDVRSDPPTYHRTSKRRRECHPKTQSAVGLSIECDHNHVATTEICDPLD